MQAGKFYGTFIDPLLNKIHSLGARTIPKGAKVIDIACGNGVLARKIAAKAAHVTGIDLSTEMIDYARKQSEKAGIKNLEFVEMDATDLSGFKDQEFDVATISMAVHQFSLETSNMILKELSRISKEIVVIDYNFPLPGGFNGLITRIIEWFAGIEHNGNFKAYLKYGGIIPIAKECGLNSNVVFGRKKSVFTVVKLKHIEAKGYSL